MPKTVACYNCCHSSVCEHVRALRKLLDSWVATQERDREAPSLLHRGVQESVARFCRGYMEGRSHA